MLSVLPPEMAEVSIKDLLPKVSYDSPRSDIKQQKLIEHVLTENKKQYLGKAYTDEWVTSLV